MRPANLIEKGIEIEEKSSLRQRDRRDTRNKSGLTTYLHPGQFFVSPDPYSVTTILGSCIAVCIHDVALRIGGIAHYLLPFRVGHGEPSPRFGNVAIKKVIDGLLGIGSQKRNLQAKLFGGACVIDAFRDRGNHLGTQNLELARSVLSDEGIDVIAEDVGGLRARKLVFHLEDGTAWVRVLKGD